MDKEFVEKLTLNDCQKKIFDGLYTPKELMQKSDLDLENICNIFFDGKECDEFSLNKRKVAKKDYRDKLIKFAKAWVKVANENGSKIRFIRNMVYSVPRYSEQVLDVIWTNITFNSLRKTVNRLWNDFGEYMNVFA